MSPLSRRRVLHIPPQLRHHLVPHQLHRPQHLLLREHPKPRPSCAPSLSSEGSRGGAEAGLARPREERPHSRSHSRRGPAALPLDKEERWLHFGDPYDPLRRPIGCDLQKALRELFDKRALPAPHIRRALDIVVRLNSEPGQSERWLTKLRPPRDLRRGGGSIILFGGRFNIAADEGNLQVNGNPALIRSLRAALVKHSWFSPASIATGSEQSAIASAVPTQLPAPPLEAATTSLSVQAAGSLISMLPPRPADGPEADAWDRLRKALTEGRD